MTAFKKNTHIWIVVGICIFALYLRSRGFNNTFSKDESHQLGLMSNNFLIFLNHLQGADYGAFLNGDHILVYPFFQIFSYNRIGLIIPHVIATILGFYLLYLICKRYFKTKLAYIITFVLVCFNCTMTRHAFEIRPYAVLPTLALACFYLSQVFVEKINMSLLKKCLFGVFFVLIMWFHIYGVFMFFPAILFSVLAKLKDKSFRNILKKTSIFVAIISCIALPLWFYCVFGKHLVYPMTRITFDFFPNPLKNPIGLLRAVFGTLTGQKSLYFLLIGVLFPLFIKNKDRFKQMLFLIVMVILPISLIFFSDLKANYWFIQRQFIWVMPFFAFFLGWVWESFFFVIFDFYSKVKTGERK